MNQWGEEAIGRMRQRRHLTLVVAWHGCQVTDTVPDAVPELHVAALADRRAAHREQHDRLDETS